MGNLTKIIFIVNPISGTSDKNRIIDLIPKYMDSRSFDWTIIRTEYRGHATILANEAIKEGADIVVAVGGDGTINEVARSLINTETALGIIPCGSGNGLARHLFIPMNPVGALRVLCDSHIERIDYGMIDKQPFFCTCGVGFDAYISDCFAKSSHRGLVTYVKNTLKEGLRYNSETYEIIIDGERHLYKAFVITCANASQYGNDAYIAPKASMKDGMMDVTLMEPFSLLEAPLLGIQLFNKTINTNANVHTFRCHHLHIKRQTPGVIHLDGDPQDAGEELDVRIIPQGIRMVVNTQEQPYSPPLLNALEKFCQVVNKRNKATTNSGIKKHFKVCSNSIP